MKVGKILDIAICPNHNSNKPANLRVASELSKSFPNFSKIISKFWSLKSENTITKKPEKPYGSNLMQTTVLLDKRTVMLCSKAPLRQLKSPGLL